MEEMYKHNETSNYDEDKNKKCLSEPDDVNKVTFD
jgi:hypothetical protein